MDVHEIDSCGTFYYYVNGSEQVSIHNANGTLIGQLKNIEALHNALESLGDDDLRLGDLSVEQAEEILKPHVEKSALDASPLGAGCAYS